MCFEEINFLASITQRVYNYACSVYIPWIGSSLQLNYWKQQASWSHDFDQSDAPNVHYKLFSKHIITHKCMTLLPLSSISVLHTEKAWAFAPYNIHVVKPEMRLFTGVAHLDKVNINCGNIGIFVMK